MIKILIFLILLLFSCTGDKTLPNYLIVEPNTQSEIVERGKYLFTVSACGSCHSKNGNKRAALAGGEKKALDHSGVKAPHLGAQFANSSEWNTESYFNFFRRNYYPCGRRVQAGEHDGYEWLADEDLLSLAAYLSSLSNKNQILERAIDSGDSNNNYNTNDKTQVIEHTHNVPETSYTFGLGAVFGTGKEIYGYVPAINPKNTRAYGKYLSDTVVRCNVCHSAKERMFHSEKYLEGGHVFTDSGTDFVVPPLGLKPEDTDDARGSFIYWSEAEMQNFLSYGVRPNGEAVNSAVCPTSYFADLQTNDRQALINFFKSLVQP